jgi:4-aminobutyrate aminotransferase
MAELRTLTSTAIPPSEVGSILIEPVQGEGGFTPAPPAFLRELRAFCDEHGILLIADEVQCGYGRTGRMWGFEHAGIVPDVVVLAKAIANGLPLSAIVSSRALQERWGRGAHGSTFGGNPVACAAGLAVLDTIESEGLVANAAARGAELRAGLERIAAEDDRIGDVRGPGLMVGVEFVRDRATREPDGSLPDRLSEACVDHGLLLLTCGSQHEVVRWIPPLDVTAAEISEGVEIFGETLASIPRDEASAGRT